MQLERKILAVEDDPISRRVLVRTLERMGATVLEADGGARALDVIERERPEIVITDWMMPEVDGLEVCRRLRASRPEGLVYAIVLTARTEPADRIAALDAGADEFLTKPVDPVELRARIQVADRVITLQHRLVEAERLATVGAIALALRHEINNPLTAILGFADLALSDPDTALPASARQALEVIRQAARKIAGTIERLESLREVHTREYLPGFGPMLDLERAPDPVAGTRLTASSAEEI